MKEYKKKMKHKEVILKKVINKDIDYFRVPNYITRIESNCFSQSSVSRVKLSENISTIYNNAFRGCHLLKDIDLSHSKLTYIGFGAFRDCIQLRKIKLSSNILLISGDMFRGCINLEEISGLDSVTEIGPFAFRDCHSLREVGFSTALKFIGAEAFCHCSELNNFELSKNRIKFIGEAAFKDTGVTKLVITKDVDINLEEVENHIKLIYRKYTFKEIIFNLLNIKL